MITPGKDGARPGWSSREAITAASEQIGNGVWKTRFGTPEPFTPVSIMSVGTAGQLARLRTVKGDPLDGVCIAAKSTPRGLVLHYRMQQDEQIFGFGLQLKSFNQTGLKKTIRVNSDPVADTGDSHAPVPFFVSTAGYGLLVDTARYVSFYSGSHILAGNIDRGATHDPKSVANGTADLYTRRHHSRKIMLIDIPGTQGVEVYLFAGATLREVIQRYVLFSGGGAFPALWGLGNWYRCKGDADQERIVQLMDRIRADKVPCDVIGLEPGWHSHAYSCTYSWSSERFPKPDELLRACGQRGFRLSLWEHSFVSAQSPLYGPLANRCGDIAVWEGLVPDLADPEARAIFGEYHRRHFIDMGVAGFKLDECDNSDYIAFPWSYPEASSFPSGLDGEQMHSLHGPLYQQTLYEQFEAAAKRTYGQVRSSHACAARFPFALYSDLYDHRDFIRGIATSSFSGLLWCPEIRQARSVEDLIRRLQTVALSAQSLVNAWYLSNPPWLQIDKEKNNAGEIMPVAPEVTRMVRQVLGLRMMLVPYLYSAFYRFHTTGVPPLRALAVDYQNEPATHEIADEFLMGEDLLVAPLTEDDHGTRRVYLPGGAWYCFFTGRRYEGTGWHDLEAPLERPIIFVKEHSLLPLACPVQCIGHDTVFDMVVRAYGPLCRDAELFEDDGETFAYLEGRCTTLTLSYREEAGGSIARRGGFDRHRYCIVGWEKHY